MNSLIEYLKSRIFLKNIVLILSFFTILLIGLMIFLRIYTHHGQAIAVPDFSDYSVQDAQKILKSRHLDYELFDSIYIPSREPGVIVDQHPKPGALIKKGRKVFFTINAHTPEKIFMPDLVGITIREARARIESAGLRLGYLSYRFDLAKNVVLEQKFKGHDITAGDTIYKGSEIDLVLGKGLSDERGIVPDLHNLTVDQAKARAADAYFSIGVPIPDESITDPDIETGFVYRQHPVHSPNVRVPLGTPITIWITLDSTKIATGIARDSADVQTDLNQMNDVQDTDDNSYNNDYTNP